MKHLNLILAFVPFIFLGCSRDTPFEVETQQDLPDGNIAGSLSKESVESTFVVTNTNDSGSGSLRQAILDANASPRFQQYCRGKFDQGTQRYLRKRP